MAGDADGNETLAQLPKIEVGRPARAPEKFQPGVSEATVSVAGKLSMRINVSEAGQRNVCDV